MRTVSDISRALGISKQAVYKTLNKPCNAQYIQRIGKVVNVTEEGVAAIWGVVAWGDDATGSPTVEQPVVSIDTLELYNLLILQKNNEIDRLTNQLNIKDAHINQLARMLDQAQQLQLHLQDQVLIKAPVTDSDKPSWRRWLGV